MNKKQLKPDRKHVQEKVTEILGDGILDCEEVDITARKVVDYIWPMVRHQADSKATTVDPGGRMWHDFRFFGNRVGLNSSAATSSEYNREPISMGDLMELVEQKENCRPRLEHNGQPFDLIQFLTDQKSWSEETFGPMEFRGFMGVLDHMKKEIAEIEEAPNDSHEWADLILLAFDAAWRSGLHPLEIVLALVIKFEINKGRTWPKWHEAEPGKAIEHIREEDG